MALSAARPAQAGRAVALPLVGRLAVGAWVNVLVVSALVGLVNANDPINESDIPFAGAATIRGQFGEAANVDYYEVEYTTTPAVPKAHLRERELTA